MTEAPQDNSPDTEDPAERDQSYPEQTKSGAAPVEPMEGDPALTEGRVITPVDEENEDDHGN